MPKLIRDRREIDSRLSELDQRLRAIQHELLPDREARPTRPALEDEAPQPPPRTHAPQPPPPTEPPQPPPRTEPPPRPPEPEPAPPPSPEPDPPAPPPPPAAAASIPPVRAASPAPKSPSIPATGALTELHAKLLSSFRELLGAYECLLSQMSPSPPGTPPGAGAASPVSPPVHASISAGPFDTVDAVRSFELAMAALPGVLDVTLRGYEGSDRAIFDVRMDEP